jgi:hypothetical protein
MRIIRDEIKKLESIALQEQNEINQARLIYLGEQERLRLE